MLSQHEWCTESTRNDLTNEMHIKLFILSIFSVENYIKFKYICATVSNGWWQRKYHTHTQTKKTCIVNVVHNLLSLSSLCHVRFLCDMEKIDKGYKNSNNN